MWKSRPFWMAHALAYGLCLAAECVIVCAQLYRVLSAQPLDYFSFLLPPLCLWRLTPLNVILTFGGLTLLSGLGQ